MRACFGFMVPPILEGDNLVLPDGCGARYSHDHAVSAFGVERHHVRGRNNSAQTGARKGCRFDLGGGVCRDGRDHRRRWVGRVAEPLAQYELRATALHLKPERLQNELSRCQVLDG